VIDNLAAAPVAQLAQVNETISAPSISYAALAPILIMLGTACVGVLIEAFAPRGWRSRLQVPVALGGCVAALIDVIVIRNTRTVTIAGAVSVDGLTLFLQGSLAILGIVTVLFVAERQVDSAGSALVAQAAVTVGSRQDRQLATATHMQTEAYPLIAFALGGMMIFPGANNLLVMFIALEVLSLPLYLLAGLARRRRLLSQEAALKYFLPGAFASAFFVYGMAMLYGYAGSVNLRDILTASQSGDGNDILLVFGFALVVLALLFKASVAPFHTWTPDVYQGSPTPITGFMASATKIAAFGALLRVFYVAFSAQTFDWRPIMWGIAIISMLVGAVFGLTQTDIKRLIAYSSIAHAGFLIIGVMSITTSGLSSTLFYLISYALATLGAFGVVTLVRNSAGEATHLSQWAGLAKRSPVTAAVFTVFLLSFAGVPLTSGFIGKFVLFKAGIDAGLGPLVVIALVASAIAAFYYLRVVVLMYFSEPPEGGPTVTVPSLATQVGIGFTALATVFLGIIPQPILDVAEHAAHLVG
jgi:NADH-quinone oxidoreductase subunit N